MTAPSKAPEGAFPCGDPIMDFVHDAIKADRLACIGVPGGETEPSFTYTVGLLPVLGFELVCVGLRCQYAHSILNAIAQVAHDGGKVELDVPDSRFTSMPLVFKRCGEQARDYVCVADAWYGQDVDAVQLVMCDPAGLFPWEPGFNDRYMAPRQPLLFTQQ